MPDLPPPAPPDPSPESRARLPHALDDYGSLRPEDAAGLGL